MTTLKERYDREIAELRATDEEYQAVELALAIAASARRLMEERGLRQTDVARRLGVSRAYVNRLLNAEPSNLTLATLARLAAALGARVEWDFRPLLEQPVGSRHWSCEGDPSLTTIEVPKYAAIPIAA